MIPRRSRSIVKHGSALMGAHSVASVSRNKSWNDMASPRNSLLQNDLLLLVEAVENFRLHTVGDAQLTLSFFFPLSALASGISTEALRSLS